MNLNRPKSGYIFETGKGHHLYVKLGDKSAILPMHGAGKELGTALVRAILKQLGLDPGKE